MHRIEDSAQPELLEHLYGGPHLPRFGFANGPVPAQVPRAIRGVESTLGLGVLGLQQPSLEAAGRILELLEQVNGTSGLLAQVEIRVEGPVGRDLLELALGRYRLRELRVEPVAMLPTIPVAVRSVEGLGLAQASLAIGVSDYHTHLAGGGSRTAQVAQLFEAMDGCLDQRIQVRIDLVDVTRCDVDGFLLPLLEACLEHLARRGSSRLRLRLCDTLGLGLPWGEAPLPRSIPRLVSTVRHATGLQPDQLEFAGGNDFGLALANTLTAALWGAGLVACATGGAGERAGIAPTELVLAHLSGLSGLTCDLRAVHDLLAILHDLGLRPSSQHPLFGERVLVSSDLPSVRPLEEVSGLHVPFDTARLLGRSPRLELRPQTGPVAIAHLIRRHVPGATAQASDENVREVHRQLGESGLKEITWEGIVDAVKERMPELFAPRQTE